MLTCQNCGEVMKGRSDKKFCSDACRNEFNNKLNRDSNNLIRNINNKLRKNRRILEQFSPDGKAIKKKKDDLLLAGFDFEYHTHRIKTKNYKEYHFVYEYGYLWLEEEGKYLIVRSRD